MKTKLQKQFNEAAEKGDVDALKRLLDEVQHREQDRRRTPEIEQAIQKTLERGLSASLTCAAEKHHLEAFEFLFARCKPENNGAGALQMAIRVDFMEGVRRLVLNNHTPPQNLSRALLMAVNHASVATATFLASHCLESGQHDALVMALRKNNPPLIQTLAAYIEPERFFSNLIQKQEWVIADRFHGFIPLDQLRQELSQAPLDALPSARSFLSAQDLNQQLTETMPSTSKPKQRRL